jgi:hypothetical protein
LLVCSDCKHEERRHLPGNGPCLSPGCTCSVCVPVDLKLMFSVRIDKVGDGYVFKVEPMPLGAELVALDSTPGVIAFVEAASPGAACQRAWEKGQRELASLSGLPAQPASKLLELLGDKKPE